MKDQKVTINNTQELKDMITVVLQDEGFLAFCQSCPIERCCNTLMTCSYAMDNLDCKENKILPCYFYICPVLNEENKEVSNWLQRLKSSIEWPNKVEWPMQLESFPGI